MVSISMTNVDYILCEHWKDKNSVATRKIFKTHPEKCSVEMNWKVNKQMVPQQLKD